MKVKRVVSALVGVTLGVTMTPAVTTAASAGDPCRLPSGVLTVNDLAGYSAVDCVAVGRLVDAGDGVALPIQPAGSGVSLGLLSPTGSTVHTVTTDRQGRVSVTRLPADVDGPAGLPAAPAGLSAAPAGRGRPGQGGGFPESPGPGPCERDTYVLAGFTWDRPWLFRTTVGSTLGTDRQSDFDAAARRATDNVVHIRNDCGIKGGITAAGAFVGHTTATGNFVYVDDQATCGVRDSQNVLDTDDLPGGFLEATLAAFCIWTETRQGRTVAVEADLRFNNGDYSWTYDPLDPDCDPDPTLPPDPIRWKYDVESIMTHEVGHVYGLVNLSSFDDVNLTMFPAIRRCSGNLRTLGLGDVLGMKALYGKP